MTTDGPSNRDGTTHGQQAGHTSAWSDRTRLLLISADEPDWTALAARLDHAGCTQPQLTWSSTAAEALRLLGRESFDCVVLADLDRTPPQDTPTNLLLLEAIQAAGCDDPLVLVVPRTDDSLWLKSCSLDVELFPSKQPWQSHALVPVIHRAVRRNQLSREQHRLSLVSKQREHRDRDEAGELLNHLHRILGRDCETHETTAAIPEGFREDYRELLRAYVIMGTGNLADQIAGQARRLAAVDFSPREALAVHVESLETLIAGLGNRSTRHVMARSDLMALELVVQLGDCYRRQRVA